MALKTIGAIAEEVGTNVWRAIYAARKARVEPVQRAGMFRLFDEAGVARIKDEVRRIQSRRQLSRV